MKGLRFALGLWVLSELGGASAVRASSLPFPLPVGLEPLVFEAVSTPATSLCPDPCFQVRIFLEDPTRQRQIQAIQMDIDVGVGARVAVLPVPPAANTNAASGNAAHDDRDRSVLLPWNLTAFVAASPTAGFDVFVVLASDTPFSIASLAATRAQYPNCIPRALCQLLEDADARNQIYLGSFKINRDGDPLTEAFEVRIGGLMGVQLDGWFPDFPYPRYARVLYPVPEPTVEIFAATAMGLGWARRRLRTLRAGEADESTPR